jgi:diguanylate cyclase (GGDEF)-like protein
MIDSTGSNNQRCQKPSSFSILVADDDLGLRSILSCILEDEGFEVTAAASAEEALALFRLHHYPLVFTDIVMESMSGIELLGEIKQLRPETEVVIMTNYACLDTAVTALRAGAYDYLFKPFTDLDLISAVSRRAVEKIRLGMENRSLLDQLKGKNQELEQVNLQLELDIVKLKRQEEKIQHLANYDLLTGLPNRTLLKDRLQQALAHGRRTNGMVALLFLDLDNFKNINDSLGHLSGDLLLAAVAKRLLACTRQSDTVARLGGDEFVVLLTSNREEQEISLVARKVLDVFAEPFELDGQELFVTTSIGISLFPQDGADGEILLKNADMAMYSAKKSEKNTFQFFSEGLNKKAKHRQGMESGLRRALQQEEFYLDYQPQVDLRTGTISGVEALLRWNHAKQGLILPDSFISIAEETGLIQPIGEWVLRAACTQAKQWHQAGLPQFRIAVNLSGFQFRRPGLAETVENILNESGLDPQWLELELTEGVLMDCTETSIKTLSALKDLGVCLAIDDFGTGYSSLNYLKHFPIDRIKIDRTFVSDIGHDPDDVAIVEAIISMSRSLSLQTIAEGVETLEAIDFLRDRGCFEMQGYFFSRPVAARELPALLKCGNFQKKLTYPHCLGRQLASAS